MKHQWANKSTRVQQPLAFPLIYCDQKLAHQSRPYLTFADADIDRPQVHGWPPIDQMHPAARRLIEAADAARERHQAELDAARVRKDFAEVSRIKKQMMEESRRETGVRP